MEDTVWIVIGVISILLLFGIIGQVVYTANKDNNAATARESVGSLSILCNRVCRMPDETYLSTKVTLAQGNILTADDTKLCISQDNSTTCERCECKLYSYTLDLTNMTLFKTHEYECFFLNQKSKLNLSCVG